MADRTSAEIFGKIFVKLAALRKQGNVADINTFAWWAWELSHRYDFSSEQLECDGALQTLGLAFINDDGKMEYER